MTICIVVGCALLIVAAFETAAAVTLYHFYRLKSPAKLARIGIEVIMGLLLAVGYINVRLFGAFLLAQGISILADSTLRKVRLPRGFPCQVIWHGGLKLLTGIAVAEIAFGCGVVILGRSLFGG